MVLVLCLLSDDVLYLHNVSWKYLKGFRVLEGLARFLISGFSKGHNSVKM